MDTKDIKYGFLSKHLLKERSNMTVAKHLWVTINLYKKWCLPIIITWNKKDSSKQALSVTSLQTYQRRINVETTLIIKADQRCYNVDIGLKMKVEPTYIYQCCFNVKMRLSFLR